MAEPAVDALTLLKETKTDEAVQALQTSLLGLETKLTQLADTVQLLGLQVETLAKKNKPIRVLRPKIKRYVVKPRLIKAVKEPIYYIKAIVPRRAWLQAEDGKALTVKVGDTLAGYGLIQAINSSEGTVATSSNKIINFDSNDN